MMNMFTQPFGMIGAGMMVLWWVLIVIAIIALARFLIDSTAKRNDAGHRDSVLDILRERYAKGEIDRQEFEAKKNDLIV